MTLWITGTRKGGTTREVMQRGFRVFKLLGGDEALHVS